MSDYSKLAFLRDARLERRRRKKLARHKYSDIELKEILDEMWKRQDAYGSLKGYPRVVTKYIKNEPSMTVSDKALVLRNRVENNLMWRISPQSGIRGLEAEESTTHPGKRVMVFTWFGIKPTLPPILESHPAIVFKQLFSDPEIYNLENTVIESGEQLFRDCSTTDSLQVPFGTLGAILTIEKECLLGRLGKNGVN
ncbi:hypothetical protein MMC22_012017 [Lobaria immixta]|nr:hypothetical protein [Lobaria immixta]